MEMIEFARQCKASLGTATPLLLTHSLSIWHRYVKYTQVHTHTCNMNYESTDRFLKSEKYDDDFYTQLATFSAGKS